MIEVQRYECTENCISMSMVYKGTWIQYSLTYVFQYADILEVECSSLNASYR
jgi:hypothetical protein